MLEVSGILLTWLIGLKSASKLLGYIHWLALPFEVCLVQLFFGAVDEWLADLGSGKQLLIFVLLT